jgi:hypothetical protein
MLSLDISGAYNNIPYKRLLYILKVKSFFSDGNRPGADGRGAKPETA